MCKAVFERLAMSTELMPANLTPAYKKAEQWFRSATTNDEKILALEQMLSIVPKHKGTDHLRADLRRKLSKLKEGGPQKGHAAHVDIFHVPRSGAGQIVLLGTPNCGKSSIVGALTKAKVNIAPFPYSTHAPCPGMVKYEDIKIEMVDMPPVTADHVASGQVGTYRHCDLIGIVIDLDGDMDEQWQTCIDFLESRRLIAGEKTPITDAYGNMLAKKVFCLGSKADLVEPGLLGLLTESSPYDMTFLELSVETGTGMDSLPQTLFGLLEIMRIYAKPPGKPVDMNDPFTLPTGSTVQDLARTIHRQMADKLKNARIWGTGVYDGQNVQLHHTLHDKDIVELHFA
jgi:ribosome-interacting GTPase 1